MHKASVCILGVPIDNLNFNEIARKIIALINLYRKNPASGYVCTVNLDFLMNAHTVSWNDILRPELLRAYRKSSLATADGMPLVWLSRLLGSPLKERVTGADLLPALAEMLGAQKKSVYLLGADSHVNKVSAMILEAVYSGICIAGRSSPPVYIEGENIENSEERDNLLVEEINRAEPDILFIALGNPKQELWFNRVRDRLKVPVAVGVGQSLDILVGTVSRAPEWMRKTGLEWVYRLLQEPKRLWQRYLIGGIKFTLVAVPLIIYHTINRCLYAICPNKKSGHVISPPRLFLSPEQSLSAITLPALIDDHFSHQVNTDLETAFNHDTLLLDFRKVCHITLEGLSLLIRIWMRAEAASRKLYALNISGDIEFLLKLHRVWDLLKESVLDSPQQVIEAIIQKESHPDYFESIQQEKDHAVLSFFGEIGPNQNAEAYFAKLEPILKGKDCMLDFYYCTMIDNTGFSFLLKLKTFVEKENHQLFVRGRNKQIRRLFYLCGLGKAFKSKDDDNF